MPGLKSSLPVVNHSSNTHFPYSMFSTSYLLLWVPSYQFIYLCFMSQWDYEILQDGNNSVLIFHTFSSLYLVYLVYWKPSANTVEYNQERQFKRALGKLNAFTGFLVKKSVWDKHKHGWKIKIFMVFLMLSMYLAATMMHFSLSISLFIRRQLGDF